MSAAPVLNKKYKIKISQDRTLGPLDFERVRALVMKGRILGTEATAEEPYSQWRDFASHPDLAQLLLIKLQKDQGQIPEESSPETSTVAQPTMTMVNTSSGSIKKSDTLNKELTGDSEASLYEIPTIINLPVPKPKEPTVDDEHTVIMMPVPVIKEGETAGGTRLLQIENIEQALEPFKPKLPENPQPTGIAAKINNVLPFKTAVNPDDYVTDTGKKRLLTRNTAALLALGIMFIAYLNNQEQDAADTEALVPKFHTFPYIEVNEPPQLGNTPDFPLSGTLTERGAKSMEQETPSGYIRAIRNYLYPAIGRNRRNYDARALLASSYMRISESIPRDSRLFDVLNKLLFPPPPNGWTPEYVVARAEFYQLLNRYDLAQETVDAYLKVRPTTELLYQKAKISLERGDLDNAIASVSKAVPIENIKQSNPRHLLLYAQLLDRKGQKTAAKQILNRLEKDSPGYGPGIMAQTEMLHRDGNNKRAKVLLKYLLARPHLFDRIQLAELWALTAKVFESTGNYPRALLFANWAYKNHYDKETMLDLVYRIKAKIPATQKAYNEILNGRVKEKSKQTDLAIMSYLKALDYDRKDPTANLALARVYEERGEINEAIDRYRKALDTPTRPHEAMENLARIYTARYELDEAEVMVKLLADLRKYKDQVYSLQGMIKLKRREPNIADLKFSAALAAKARIPNLYNALGDFETDRKNQKLAEFYYSMALRYDPLDPRATLGVALTRFHLDSPSRAIAFLKDKLKAQPNSAAIMTNLAVIHLESGDQDSGKNYLQNAIRSNAKYAEAFRLLGDLTRKEGNRQQDNYAARRNSYRYALASYEMYSKLAPSDPEGYRATGDLYFEILDLGAAAKNYHKVKELTPKYPDIRLRLAQISRNGGDAKTALELINEEIKISPNSDAAWVEKGNILMAKRDLLGASAAYTQAAQINEKNADALFGLGVVHHMQGGFDNALSLFARVIKLNALKSEVFWQMGLIYQKQNNRQKAIQSFSDYKATVRDPAAAAKAEEKIKELANF